MKTDISKFIKSFFVSFIAVFISTSLNAQAPSCSYGVHNAGSCNAIVNVDFYDNFNALCLSSGNTVVASGVTLGFTCGACTQPLGNIVVTLISINGNTPTGTGFVDINGTHDQGGYTSGSTCTTPPQYNYTLDWFYNFTDVAY